MAEHHKLAGKAGGKMSSRAGIKNYITKDHNIIHGENALVRVDSLPDGASQIVMDAITSGFIIAHSETGHHHVIEKKTDKTTQPKIAFYAKDGITYMLVKEQSEIVHKKSFDIHETKTIKKGIWKITKKTEYDPFTQLIRDVRD